MRINAYRPTRRRFIDWNAVGWACIAAASFVVSWAALFVAFGFGAWAVFSVFGQ